jgi:hypothetical protein
MQPPEENRVGQKKTTAIILLLLAYGAELLSGLLFISSYASTLNYHLFSVAGLTALYIILSVLTLVLTGIALWFLWFPQPVGFWIALSALVLPILEALLILIITLIDPELAREAMVSHRTAQGLPESELATVNAAVSASGAFVTFVKSIDAKVLLAILLSWKHEYFFGPRPICEYGQVTEQDVIDKVKRKHRANIDILKKLGFQEWCVSSESVSVWGSSAGVLGLLAFFMVWFKEIAKLRGFFKITSYYPILVSREQGTYAYAFGLGVKFFTNFHDGTGLISTNFESRGFHNVDAKLYKFSKAQRIENAWLSHQKRIGEFVAEGKRLRDRLHFEDYAELAMREDACEAAYKPWSLAEIASTEKASVDS